MKCQHFPRTQLRSIIDNIIYGSMNAPKASVTEQDIKMLYNRKASYVMFVIDLRAASRLLWGAVCVKIYVFPLVSYNEFYNYTKHSIQLYNAFYNI